MSLLNALEADETTPLEEILSVPDDTLQEVIRTMKKEPDEVALISPIAQGKVRLFLQKCRGPIKIEAAPVAPPPVVSLPAPVAAPPTTKRNMSDVLDQVDSETTYELLDPATLGALRASRPTSVPVADLLQSRLCRPLTRYPL